MLDKETVYVAAGEVPRERWYLLTSMSSRQCGPEDLLRLVRNYWSIENSLHHVKDRSWDEAMHTLSLPHAGHYCLALWTSSLTLKAPWGLGWL